MSGFLLHGDSFVWTKKGLIKVKELEEGDEVLGLNEKGVSFWGTLPEKASKYGPNLMSRILTDHGEGFLSESCEVFSLAAIKSAKKVDIGEYIAFFYDPKIVEQIRHSLKEKEYREVSIHGEQIKIDENWGYILGRARIKNSTLCVDVNVQTSTNKIIKICYAALKNMSIPGKVFLTRRGEQIRISSDLIMGLFNELFPEGGGNIPKIIRSGPLSVYQHYLAGVLEKRIKFLDENFIGIRSLGTEHELRRFLFNSLWLFGAPPDKVVIEEKPSKAREIIIMINRNKAQAIKLIDYEIGKALKVDTKAAPKYVQVKRRDSFWGIAYVLPAPQIHWSPVIDLFPLHRHVLSYKLEKPIRLT